MCSLISLINAPGLDILCMQVWGNIHIVPQKATTVQQILQTGPLSALVLALDSRGHGPLQRKNIFISTSSI